MNFDFSTDQATIAIVIVIVVLVAGYLAKLALKFVIAIAAIGAVFYVLTTSPSDISVSHVIDWLNSHTSTAINKLKDEL